MIPVSYPSIGNEELAGVKKVFDSGWLMMGAQVFEFEQKIQEFLGVDHVVCTNSGTNALHLALDSLDIGRGDEVILPAITFAGCAQAIVAAGAMPVFCDVNPTDANMDPYIMESKITSRTKAIMPVHYRGFPCDMDHIGEIASNSGLHIIEDAAHAFGSSYKGKKIGLTSGSDIACFSFDAIKNITCGEGGAVVFSDDSLLEKVQQKRMVGIDKDTWHRYRNERSWFFDVVTNGYRYHMSNINAAIGLAQLPKFDKMNKRKIEIAEMYDEAFCSLYDITLLNHDYTDIGLFMYVMRVNTRRNEMMDYLKDKGIGSGIHYIPIYKYSYFMDRLNKFPVSDLLYDEIITLPLFPDMTDEQVSYVIKSIGDF